MKPVFCKVFIVLGFLFRFMRGELNSRAEGLINRGVGAFNKGDATPGTPSTNLGRQPPIYQRMHSNDSGSGKGSDNGVPRD